MQQDLESVCQQISDAYRPEDLFGVEEVLLPPETMCEFLERRYTTFKALLNPGLEELEFRELAQEALEKLEQLREEARQKIGRFHYGMIGFDLPRPAVKKAFSVAHNRYLVGPRLDGTDQFDRFQGFLERDGQYLGEVEIRLASNASENPLLLREARAIDLLHQSAVPQWKHLPCLLDRFETDQRVGLTTVLSTD